MSEKFLKNLNGDIIGINIKWVLEKNKEIEKSRYLRCGVCDQTFKDEEQARAFREWVTKCKEVQS